MGVRHKKTRKQKIIADYRHQVYSLENKNVSLTVSPTIPTITINQNSSSHSYVLHDISKTGILTLLIVAAQIVLFLFLTNHIISLPNLSY